MSGMMDCPQNDHKSALKPLLVSACASILHCSASFHNEAGLVTCVMAYSFASLWVRDARLIFGRVGGLAELVVRGVLAMGNSVTLRPSSEVVILRAWR